MVAQYFQSSCWLCQQQIDTPEQVICSYCQTSLFTFNQIEEGNLLQIPVIKQGIYQPKFDELFAISAYDWPFSYWIKQLKFAHRRRFITPIINEAHSVFKKIEQNTATVMLSIPSYRDRLFWRGFNPAGLLAEALSKRLNLIYQPNWLLKIRSTPRQTTQHKIGRLKQLKQSFKYIGPKVEKVILFDDVLTTGATINTVCQELKKNGVNKISVWTVCITLPKGVKLK